jgi:hypothetical protein
MARSVPCVALTIIVHIPANALTALATVHAFRAITDRHALANPAALMKTAKRMIVNRLCCQYALQITGVLIVLMIVAACVRYPAGQHSVGF